MLGAKCDFFVYDMSKEQHGLECSLMKGDVTRQDVEYTGEDRIICGLPLRYSKSVNYEF